MVLQPAYLIFHIGARYGDVVVALGNALCRVGEHAKGLHLTTYQQAAQAEEDKYSDNGDDNDHDGQFAVVA